VGTESVDTGSRLYIYIYIYIYVRLFQRIFAVSYSHRQGALIHEEVRTLVYQCSLMMAMRNSGNMLGSHQYMWITEMCCAIFW
jgi:hypothetical protein